MPKKFLTTKGFSEEWFFEFLVCFVSFVVINKHWEKIHHEVHEEHEGSFHGGFFLLFVSFASW
jgi:hypothetical protein